MPKTNKDIPFAQPRSIFGDFSEEHLNSPDHSDFFIQGYSDKKIKNEHAMAKGKRPPFLLKFRLQYVLSQRADGRADRRKVSEFLKKRYFIVKYDEALDESGKLGIDLTTSPALKDADGNACLAEYLLMACPADMAARWDHENRAAIDAGVSGVLPTQVDINGDPIFTLNEEEFSAPRA